MSQESAVDSRLSQNMRAAADHQQIISQPKPTFAALDKAIGEAADSVDLTDQFRAAANEALKNQLFKSPRLQHWQLGVSKDGVSGYTLQNSTQDATIIVTDGRVILSCPDPSNPKYPYDYEVMVGLPAQTLFKSIQDAQAIVQPRSMILHAEDVSSEEFFNAGSEDYFAGAGLDAALEETHADPLVADDAELIEDVVSANPDSDEETDVEAELASITKEAEDLKNEIQQRSHTARMNQKNAITDGVECEICGNLNRDAYRGTCPQCPKKLSVTKILPQPKGNIATSFATGRFKSLQGRILTIIDGTFADKTQREAVKTLINKEFRAEITKVSGE